MIHEYALDPAVLASWASNRRDYAEFLREYGIGTPRLISSFPRKKATKLRSYLLSKCPINRQSLASQRYEEMVQKIVESVIVREVDDVELAEWQEKVVLENNRVSFDVILLITEIQEENAVTLETMYSQGSIWNHPNQINVSRTNKDLLNAVMNLVRLSTERIVIIDPYGWTDEAISFIQFMLQSININRVSGGLPTVTLFYKEKRGGSGRGSPSASHVKQAVTQGLAPELSDLKLEVIELSETCNTDVFHNRYVLTEHGGVGIGHGIGVSGNGIQTDEIYLVTGDIYRKKWNQFIEKNCFQLISAA
ncbi:MAG: hypothetical protein KJ609_05815 [Gammaproteobacteria bacterium]|nr:hypothetical protein [Gammaproteobacteria bacterium]MBU1469023.1 hypothetical protein [Gammaproteobacteria bacterium]MBU2024304.1 hypothetical protein [Gammaproteobacteria bacterium]MBU2238250.1 hypothetical protein [Gammaproteobacteria bacterium]MBU2318046.1 hypothetical protein [Gammaproteobacteria bacterium]